MRQGILASYLEFSERRVFDAAGNLTGQKQVDQLNILGAEVVRLARTLKNG